MLVYRRRRFLTNAVTVAHCNVMLCCFLEGRQLLQFYRFKYVKSTNKHLNYILKSVTCLLLAEWRQIILIYQSKFGFSTQAFCWWHKRNNLPESDKVSNKTTGTKTEDLVSEVQGLLFTFLDLRNYLSCPM